MRCEWIRQTSLTNWLAIPRDGSSLFHKNPEILFWLPPWKFCSRTVLKHLETLQNYKVVRLDFSNLKPSSGIFEFRKALTDFLIDSFRSVGFSYDKEGTSVFSQLSRWLKTIPPCTLVLLIVDYDFPLTYSMSNEKLYRDVGYVLSEFYALLKSNDGAFRFLLITGVTDFRQTCLLNDLNHLTDLKRLSQGSLLGVSSDDLVRGFDDCLTQPSETVPTKNNNIWRTFNLHCFPSWDGLLFSRLLESLED